MLELARAVHIGSDMKIKAKWVEGIGPRIPKGNLTYCTDRETYRHADMAWLRAYVQRTPRAQLRVRLTVWDSGGQHQCVTDGPSTVAGLRAAKREAKRRVEAGAGMAAVTARLYMPYAGDQFAVDFGWYEPCT